MAGINHIRRWVMSQMTKKSDDGIMITLPDSKKVDLNLNITMDRLLRNGFDPDAFTNPQQVDNAVNMINSRMVSRAIPADSAEGREITEKIFGKQKAPVFDLEGNRIPEGSGIMGGKSVKNLMETGQVTKGARGMKKSKKVQDREMFKAANERLKTDAEIKAEIEAGNKKGIAGIKNKRQLTEDEYQDFLDEVGGADQLEAYDFDGTVGDAKRIIKEQKDYMSQMEMEFRKGKLDPEPGSRTPQRKRFLQKKLEEAESSGDARLLSREEREELFDLDDIPEYAKGGRIGFKGGADMGTVADSKGNVGAKSVSVSASGDVRTSRTRGPDGPDDRGSNVQNAVQAAINRGVTPRQINRITNPSVIDKIKESRFNNPLTRGLLRTGLYTLNPSLGAVDFRKAMQAKNLYDYTKDQISNPVDEEDLTLGLITDQQKGIIDKQGNIGKLTGAFDPDSTFDAAKQFDDEGSSGILGIGGRDAEPMTREEFDAYVKEKGYATGGRAAFMAGGMGRRGFLKMLAGLGGGIAAAKTGLLKLAGKEPAKQVAKEVVQQSASTPPPYFFKLAEKIKTLGRVTDGPQERLKIHTMPAKDGKSELMLTEDLGTGEMQIKKIGKEGDEMVTEVQTMDYTPGSSQADETTQGIPADQYDEYTEFNSRIYKDEFNDPDIVEGIKVDEIIEEVKDQAPSIKKAGGGIARMLGE